MAPVSLAEDARDTRPSLFMATKKKIVVAIALSVSVAILGYFLFTPDLLAFQTRVIAVREAHRNNQSILETLRSTERMETIRAKCGNDNRLTSEEAACDFQNEVRAVLNSKPDIQELLNYLRIYGTAMNADFASNRRDETGAYAAIFLLILEKLRDAMNRGLVDRSELTKIKDELNLEGMDSAEFDAVLENRPFP